MTKFDRDKSSCVSIIVVIAAVAVLMFVSLLQWHWSFVSMAQKR